MNLNLKLALISSAAILATILLMGLVAISYA
ncbi:hypothetical protein SAMN04488540_10674 [Ferrimonas sediminum]|uniref:YnhF family membrane protein n=1 Tax=Ferrimonas sediminum TaxID=718193 RepID=A0A1G8S580_9GAMM|nr:hypothetical protein SAMN04488540_10674 [Ferrimonas sediminum]